jgi:hypothetical protein
VHTCLLLIAETSHRHSVQERRVKAAAIDTLAARSNEPGPRSARQMLALARPVRLSRFSILAVSTPRLTLRAVRARP